MSHLQTITSWLKENTDRLKKAGVASARLDVTVLLEEVLQKDRAWLAAHSDEEINQEDLRKLNGFVTQRERRVPLAYILGSKEFYGRSFLVNKDVLIPRPESEAIIELLKEVTGIVDDVNTVIDIGTGSGCLAITVKKELPDVHVTGIDISDRALKVARKNARLHTAQIQWKKMDIQKEFPKMPKTRPYIVVANLPYVPKKLITSEEITKEPPIALFSGSDGLDHYRMFWQQISTLKNKPFAILTESLISQHQQLESLGKSAGYSREKTTDLIQQFILRSKI